MPMPMPTINEPVWRKSTRSNDPDIGACVQLADLTDVRGIRDSKNPHGPHLSVSVPVLSRLIASIKANELDL